MSQPVFPVPPHLAAILEAAGFKPALTATRADDSPLTEADVALIRRLLAAYGNGEARYTDAELSAGLRAMRASAPKATGTGGE
jgi:hypothetical protein